MLHKGIDERIADMHTRDMNTNTAAAAATDFFVTAEYAPIGVQLWPTTSPEYAPNFTLASVAVVRNEAGLYVVWTYENGNQRRFEMGEQIACRKAA